MLVFQMSDLHFIEKFCKDVQAILGFAVVVEVHRGPTVEQKRWTRLDPDTVQTYDYSINFSEQYRVIAPNTRETVENGYWNGVVSNFYLQYLPGCCGVCLSYHAAVTRKFLGKKLGLLTRQLREDIALAQGFTAMLSTATANNTQQTKIMKKSKRTIPVYSFKNHRSGNEVIVSVCDLRKGTGFGQTSTIPAKRPADWDREPVPVAAPVIQAAA